MSNVPSTFLRGGSVNTHPESAATCNSGSRIGLAGSCLRKGSNAQIPSYHENWSHAMHEKNTSWTL